jgi:serine/threonine protein kinase
MELVRGVPITEYCDQNHLPTDERLKLFISVCQAVQHAHQKGIIHRDLKPSNVLVTLHDGKPVVKVIDFGVAKAINQQLTEKTLFTTYGQMIGTPQYMSPEQAEMSGLDVDTRSDIYSLGVLLYELLTGTTPLESERLRTAGYAEMQRMIKEEEPPKPSTRLSTSGEKLTVIAKHRGLSPDRLQRQIRGDLDWIVMKALEKDRTRRYETANNLAGDVQRFMSNEPIEARAPSIVYRFRRFVRRNKLPIAVSALLATILIGSTLIAVLGWRTERRILQEKQRTLDQLADTAYREALTAALAGNTLRAEKALAVARGTIEMPNRIRALQGLLVLNQGD